MNSFQVIVLSIAVVILILVLTFVGVLMSRTTGSTVFPPTANDCPDYWQVRSDGTGCNIPMPGAANLGSVYNNGKLSLNGDNTNGGLLTDSKGTQYINFKDALMWKGACDKKNGLVRKMYTGMEFPIIMGPVKGNQGHQNSRSESQTLKPLLFIIRVL